jgi:hypothetical protein
MTVTGQVDYMIHVVTTDMHAYDNFLRDKLLGSATRLRCAVAHCDPRGKAHDGPAAGSRRERQVMRLAGQARSRCRNWLNVAADIAGKGAATPEPVLAVERERRLEGLARAGFQADPPVAALARQVQKRSPASPSRRPWRRLILSVSAWISARRDLRPAALIAPMASKVSPSHTDRNVTSGRCRPLRSSAKL